MQPILQIILPIFVIILGGYFLRVLGLVKIHWLPVINSLAFRVSLPALIIISFWGINWADSQVWKILGLNLISLTIFSLLFGFLLWKLQIKPKMRAAIFLVGITGNTVYMGFPVVGGAFSAGDFFQVVSVATAHLVFGTIFGVLGVEIFVLRTKKFGVYFWDLVKNPLMQALVIGWILGILKLNHPAFDAIKKPLSMVGATASPLALFMLGAFLYGKLSPKHAWDSLFATGIKLLILPAFMGLVLNLFGAGSVTSAISVLVSAMPAAVTCFVIAEEYQLEEAFVANTILFSTVISFFTLTVLLVLFR